MLIMLLLTATKFMYSNCNVYAGPTICLARGRENFCRLGEERRGSRWNYEVRNFVY